MLTRAIVRPVVWLSLALTGCSGNHADWKTYGNSSTPFTISYPQGDTLNDAYVYEALGPGKEIHGVSITIAEPLHQGTNLASDTRLSVELLPAASACTPQLFLDHVDGTRSETQGSITFNVADANDAGAGNLYEETVFAVANGPSCVAVRYFIHSHQIGNYDPGSVTAFDRAALLRHFDEIRKTLVIAPRR